MGMTGLHSLREEDFLEIVRESILNVKDPEFGAVGDGVVDDTAAWTKVLAEAALSDRRWVWAPGGQYKITSNLYPVKGVSVSGVGGAYRPGVGCTRFNYYGTGGCFELGADDGQPWDSSLYNGLGSNRFEGIAFIYSGSSTTALNNGQGVYGTTAYGIRDWRGGDIRLQDVRFEHFFHGFWGINSDVNNWFNVEFIRNKVGMYLGPRSDQFMGIGIYGFYNDTLIDCDRVYGACFFGLRSVGNGSLTTPHVKIHSEWTGTACSNIVFENPWFEHFDAATGPDLPSINAFVEIGVNQASASTNDDIKINNPLILTVAYTGAAIGEARYLATVDRCQGLEINCPTGYGWVNLQKLIEFVGTSNVRAHVRVRGFEETEAGWVNNGTGNPVPSYERYDSFSSLGTTVIEPLLRVRRANVPGEGWTGDSGFAGVLNARTALVVETNNGAGAAISIIAPNIGQSILFLGDQDSEIVGQVAFDHSTNRLKLVSGFTGALVEQHGLAITDDTTPPSWGGGSHGILFIKNRDVVPSSNPVGGGLIYVEAGALKYRGSSGTITTLGPA